MFLLPRSFQSSDQFFLLRPLRLLVVAVFLLSPIPTESSCGALPKSLLIRGRSWIHFPPLETLPVSFFLFDYSVLWATLNVVLPFSTLTRERLLFVQGRAPDGLQVYHTSFLPVISSRRSSFALRPLSPFSAFFFL